MFNELEETVLSITIFACTSLVTLITNITAIKYLYSHLKKNDIAIIGSLKLLFFPFVIWICSTLLFMASSNHLISENNTFFIIDDYCHYLCTILKFLACIVPQSSSIFLLIRMKHIFKSTPFSLTTSEFYIQFIICIIVAVIDVIGNFYSLQPTIFIAMDDPKYKLCHPDIILTDSPSKLMWIPMILNDAFLFYVFFKRYIKLNSPIDKDVKYLKTGIILLFISKIVIRSMIYASFVLYKIKYLFAVHGVIDCCILLYSVDGKLCRNDDQRQINETSQEEVDEYLRRIEEAYYAVPQRSMMDKEDIDSNDDRAPLIQIERN